MSIRNAPLLTTFRAIFFALLVFGLVAKPIVNQLGDLHAVEHVALTEGVVGQDHSHDGDTIHHGSDSHDYEQHPDHIKGAHVLMHQADSGSSATPWAVEFLPFARPPAQVVPMPDSGPPATSHRTSPFRPPIA